MWIEILRLLKQKAIFKTVIVTITLFLVALFIQDYYDPSIISIWEYALMLIDNRILMLVIFTFLPFVLTRSTIETIPYDMHIAIKLKGINAWYYTRIICLVLFSVLFVLLAGVCIICVSALSGFSPISSWEESYFFYGQAVRADSFDQIGNPFILLIRNGTSPVQSFYIALLPLSFRISFYNIVLFICSNTPKGTVLGILGVGAFAWIEVYIYAILCIQKPWGILPFEHSLISSINAYRLPFAFSVIYWLALLTSIISFGAYSRTKTMNPTKNPF